MKKEMLKSGIATLVLAIMFIMPTMAQNGKGKTPQERATRMTEKMSKKLGLDDAQTQQLASLNQAFANELSSIKDQDTDRETKRAAVKSAKDQHQSQIQGILNAEQQAKFQEIAEKRKERMKNRRGKRGNK